MLCNIQKNSQLPSTGVYFSIKNHIIFVLYLPFPVNTSMMQVQYMICGSGGHFSEKGGGILPDHLVVTSSPESKLLQ